MTVRRTTNTNSGSQRGCQLPKRPARGAYRGEERFLCGRPPSCGGGMQMGISCCRICRSYLSYRSYFSDRNICFHICHLNAFQLMLSCKRKRERDEDTRTKFGISNFVRNARGGLIKQKAKCQRAKTRQDAKEPFPLRTAECERVCGQQNRTWATS